MGGFHCFASQSVQSGRRDRLIEEERHDVFDMDAWIGVRLGLALLRATRISTSRSLPMISSAVRRFWASPFPSLMVRPGKSKDHFGWADHKRAAPTPATRNKVGFR